MVAPPPSAPCPAGEGGRQAPSGPAPAGPPAATSWATAVPGLFARLEAAAAHLPCVPPGTADGLGGRAAVAALEPLPDALVARLWRPFGEWLAGKTATA
eukprot:9892962-Alexandrium_andersonii.AAC.1